MKLEEPNTWKNPQTHYLKIIENPWYKILIKLQNLIPFVVVIKIT